MRKTVQTIRSCGGCWRAWEEYSFSGNMGWFRSRGGVIGDPALDYLDALGRTYGSPVELPGEVRERLEAIYVEGLGRMPTSEDLADLLAYDRTEGS